MMSPLLNLSTREFAHTCRLCRPARLLDVRLCWAPCRLRVLWLRRA